MKRKISEERKQQLREQLEKARLKKKPAEYKNIHQSVLDLPDDAQYSFKNVREWIKDNKEQISALNKSARSFRTDPKDKQKASNLADSKKSYIRMCEHYLKTKSYSFLTDTNQKIPQKLIQTLQRLEKTLHGVNNLQRD